MIAPTIRADWRRRHLVRHLASLGVTRGAEIGVCTGRFSRELCDGIPSLANLLCIDPWRAFNGNRPEGWGRSQEFHDANYVEAVARLAPCDAARILRAESLEAARDVEPASLDFVYIDGNHRFDYVMQDLIVWGSKVRPGGIVSGDDYYVWREHEKGVVLAVDAYVEAHKIPEWFVLSNRSKSWYWLQP